MRYFFVCLSILFINSYLINAQIAAFDFENNLTESVAGNDAVYIVNGAPSANMPNYVSGASNQKILLDSLEGLEIPLSFNTLIDTASSLEIEFDFVLTDIGNGSGRMALLANQDNDNDNGISIIVQHDQSSSTPSYSIIFIYADGGFLNTVDHPGHEEVVIGEFLEGDVINIRLIIDFQTKQMTSLVSGNYTNIFFNDGYILDSIKNSLLTQTFYVGWKNFQEQDMAFESGLYTSTATFDNLDFYSPRKIGDSVVLQNAIQAMTAHVNNTTPLTEAQQLIHLTNIQLNLFGNLASIESDVFDFTTAYENNNEAVFTNRDESVFSTLPATTQLLIFLQQAIFDEQYTPANVANMAGVKFETADVFPGTVDASAPRVNNAIVEIDGTYSHIQGARQVDDLSPVKRPTGYYVPPGELVNISIPPALINAGLTVLVGAHDSDHSSLEQTNRFVRISKEFPLDATTIQVTNPFGGGLYIKVPEGSSLGWFDIQIDDAVKAPYFSYRAGRETPLAQWQNELSQEHVPWVDIESDKYMMTMPLTHMAAITDPTALMDGWNDIMDAYQFIGGRPVTRTRAEYFLVDARLPSNAFGTGYPQVIGDGEAPYFDLGSAELLPTQILNPDFHISEFHITLHEKGHGALHPTVNGETEAQIHINATYIYNQLYGIPLEESFQRSSDELFTIDQAAMDWMISQNFRTNNPMGCDPTMDDFECDEIRYQHRGHAKYIEMAELFGWSAVHEMNKPYYEDWSVNIGDAQLNVTTDNALQFASQATGYNMAPLFHFWGHIPSPQLKAELDTMPQSIEIYRSLLHYKEIIPNTAAEFQPWYNILLIKDPVHHPRLNFTLNNYDSANFSQDMNDQIDFLIATYFTLCDDNITLNAGWNLISSNCISASRTMDEIVNGISANLIEVRDLTNQYIPGATINTLNDWDVTSGYYVNMNQAATLNISGIRANPAHIPLVLETGWNLKSYLPANNESPATALQSISSNIIEVKDMTDSYAPLFNYDHIELLETNKGYLFKMGVADTLIYEE